MRTATIPHRDTQTFLTHIFGPGLGGGRKALGEEAAQNLPAIRQKCSKDFGALAQRLETEARKQ